MLQIIGLLSGVVATVGLVPYIIDIVRGKTKPERASWLIWTVLAVIAFFSQLADGATNSLWMTAFQTINVTVVLLLSIKFGVGGFSKRDILCLLAAGLGILVWQLTQNPLTSLLIIIFVDGIGVYLTFIKTLKDPESETLIAWILATLSGSLGMIAVGKLDISLLLYPAYIGIANLLITLAILKGFSKVSAKSTKK